MADAAQVHETAVIDPGARLGAGTRVWHFSHVMPGARVGRDCMLGQNVFVGRNVRIGDGTKVQNNVSVYEGVVVGRRCFLGPSMVFTNVRTPRAEVERKESFGKTVVADGVTIGANATIVCGTRLGRYAVVGAGAVVTRDVPAHRVVVGVPARPTGWACRCGAVLREAHGAHGAPGSHACPDCGARYRVRGSRLKAEASGAGA